MLNTRRLLFLLSFLTCFTVGEIAFGQSESYIRQALQGKYVDKKPIEFTLGSSINKLGNFYKVDLNFDSFKDGILLKAGDHQQEILIFNAKKELIKTFKMQYVGFNSSTLKYSLNSLGRGVFLVIFYFAEGRINYLERSNSVRTYLMTINKYVDEENLYFQRGPILMDEFSSKRHGHLVKSNLDLIDLDKNGIKDIVIESSSGRKSIYVLSKDKYWSKF
jgi:hypothetical protein